MNVDQLTLKGWVIRKQIPHAEEMKRAPMLKWSENKCLTLKRWEEHLLGWNDQNTMTSRGSDEDGTYADMIKTNTSRLRDEKSSQLKERLWKQQSGTKTPLLSLAILRRFINDIQTSNEPSRGMLAGYSLSIKTNSKIIMKENEWKLVKICQKQ